MATTDVHDQSGGLYSVSEDWKSIGTLAIILPSQYTGGAFRVKDNGEEEACFDFQSDNTSQLHFVMWRRDSEMTSDPVQSGCRVALLYDIVWVKRFGLFQPAVPRAPEFRHLLHIWGCCRSYLPTRLVYKCHTEEEASTLLATLGPIAADEAFEFHRTIVLYDVRMFEPISSMYVGLTRQRRADLARV